MRTKQPNKCLYHICNWGRGWRHKIDLSPPVIHYWPFHCSDSDVVFCCLFWCQSFGDVSPYVCSLCFNLVWVAETTFWPFVLIVFCLLVILVICQFGFESWIWFLIAPVPVHCFLGTFWIKVNNEQKLKPSKSKSRRKINEITNRRNTIQTHSQSSGQLFPKMWLLSKANQTNTVVY